MSSFPIAPSSWKEFFLTHPEHLEFNDNLTTLFNSLDGSNSPPADHFAITSSSPQISFLLLEPVHLDILLCIHNFIFATSNLLHRITTHIIHASISKDPLITLTVNLSSLFTPKCDHLKRAVCSKRAETFTHTYTHTSPH